MQTFAELLFGFCPPILPGERPGKTEYALKHQRVISSVERRQDGKLAAKRLLGLCELMTVAMDEPDVAIASGDMRMVVSRRGRGRLG